MRVTRLDQDPMISTGLEFQQRLSRAKTIPELMAVTAQGLHECFGVSSLGHAFAPTAPGEPMTCQRWVRVDEGPLAPERLTPADAPGQTIEPGSTLHTLLSDGAPKIARDVDTEADPILKAAAPDTKSIVVIPMVSAAGVADWLVLCWNDDDKYADPNAGLVIATMNMLGRAVDHMRTRDEIRALNTTLDAQLSEVARVQRSILPEAPPEIPGYEIAVFYQPCDAAGGDYYDFRTFDSGRHGMMVADVSGHGPGAAVVMAMMRTAMASERMVAGEPGTTVLHVNAVMHDGLEMGTFVTALFVAFDPETARFQSVSAGHPPPRLVRRDGSIEVAVVDGCMPLGIVPEMKPDREAPPFELQPGDRMLMHTDGLNEAGSPSHELFGFDRLDKVLGATDPDESAQATLDRVIQAIRAHEAGADRADDQCAVIIRRLVD
ncbi:MAG: PP2C family protein-serine/threonine phosphatase [Planctomycetota bacterium]